MRKTSCMFVAVAALMVSASAVADMYPAVFVRYAALGTGGLEFKKNTAVRMAAEDLYISPIKVRVRYEFVNKTDKDVEILVAFPLPDIDNSKYISESYVRRKFGDSILECTPKVRHDK